MHEDDRERLAEMRRYASEAREWSGALGEGWIRDPKTVAAVAHVVGQIGESARHLSPAARAELGAIPWRDIVAMRNRIYHDYGGLKIERLEVIVDRDLPQLIGQLDAALSAD